MAFEILEDRATPATLSNFLTVEHVDIEIGYSGGPTGEWTITAHDDENDIEHEASDALLYVGADALTTRSGGDGLGFVGVAPGESFFHLTQSQDPDRLYLGFSAFSSSDFDTYDVTTESGGRSSGQGQWLKVSLVDVEHTNPDGTPGTGKFSVWQEDLSVPVPFMVSSDGIAADDALWITASGHLHYNFGFSQAGRYEVSLKTSGYYIPGGGANSSLVEGTYTESDPIKVYFSVNSVGQIQFDSANTAVNEQAGYRTIPVKRVGGSDGQIQINYATSDGTATLVDGDYVSSSGTLTFADGETEKVITVQVANAGVDVANETFNLTLTVPTSAAPGDTGYLNSHLLSTAGDDLLGTNATTAITINDTPTVGTITDPTTTIGVATAAIPFTVSDAETAAGSLSITAFSTNPTLLPNSGIVLGGSDGSRTITLSPVAGQSGAAQVTILVTDAGGAVAVRQFTLRVGAATVATKLLQTDSIPDVVLTADDSFTLNYNVTNTAWVTTVTRTNTILFNTPSTSSSSDLRTQPNSGGTDRTLRIRPSDNSTSAGDYGTDTVTLGFTGTGAPAARTFNVRVNPRAVADNQLLAIPGTTNTFDVLANDVTPLTGHTFNITGVSTPANGTLSITPDGKYVRYTPTNPDAYFDTFTYTVTVSSSDVFNGFTFTGIGYVKIGGYVVVDSATQSQHIDLDFDYISGEWVQNIRTQPSIVGSVQSGNFSDTILDSDEGVLFFDPSTKKTLTAGAELDILAPVLGVSAGDSVWVGPSSSSGNKLYLGIANESTSADIDSYVPAEYSWASAAQYVRTDLVGFSGPGHFAATDGQFYFDTLDGLNSANEATVGDNPADSFFGFRGSHAHLSWYFTAPGKYELTFRSSVRVGGVFVYSPESTFTFYVDSMAGDFRLTENPPLARPDTATVNEDSGATVINVLANDTSDADPFEVLTVTGVTQGNNGGSVSIGAGGANVIYTPAANFFGSETFTYTVTDEHGGVATQTVTMTVNSINDLPTISDITDRFVVENTSTGAIAFTVGDVETAAGDLVVTATSSNTTIVPNANIVLGGSGANRTITITSAANQVGPVTITVTVADATGGQASDTFVLTVGDLVRATFDKSVEIKSVNNLEDTRLADVDNDGDLDILYAKRATSISILPNNGNGTFGTDIVLPAITVSDIHVADMNGDSLPDIVSSVYDDTTYDETAIAIWHNLGGGSFLAQQIVESTRTTAYLGLIGVGDVNGDGLQDLLLSVNGSPSDNGVSYSLNLGSGTFGPVEGIFSGGVTWGSAVHDLDQDGDLDIVRVHDMNDTFQVQLLRNSGTSTPVFTSEDLASFGGDSGGHIAVSDTNQDGFVDIHLIRRTSTKDILALRGTATGVFSAPIVIASGGTEQHFTALKIGDIDGDSRPDLVLSRRDSNDVLFAQNLGAGTFTELQEFTSDGAYLNPGHEWVDMGDIDGDGRTDLVYGERFGDRIAWSRNRSEENITALTPPASRTYLNGSPMTFDVFLGFNAKVNTTAGSPTLPVTIGSQTIQVPLIGQPNANTLRFSHLVQSTDIDLDGIQVANSVALNGAIITDVHNRLLDPALLEYPAVDTTAVLVNGGAPFVTGIMRLDATPAASSSVRFEVTLSEPVTGVTIDDFSLDATGPTGTSITSVTGSGTTYVVTAHIGTGDGTLKLRVLDDDSIIDGNSQPLGGVGVGSGEFAFGQGYTIRSSTVTPTFNNNLRDGHLDLSLLLYEGVWYPYWNGVGFWDTTDTVLSAGPDARVIRPADPSWDFLGVAAGETVWVYPETYSTTTPWPGVGAYDNLPGTFARYFESDPRVNATSDWLKLQLLDVRGPEGGEFSLYQIGITSPVAFMTSANGIGAEDAAWIPNLDHIHYNWAFSKPGLYQIDVVASGYIDLNQTGAYEPGVDPLSESQIITLHFAVEVKPVALADAFTVATGNSVRGNVLFNDSDADGDPLTAVLVTGAAKGSVVLNADGTFTYTPGTTFNGADSFTYRAGDGSLQSAETTVTINLPGGQHFDAALSTGHVDIGVAYEGGWNLHVHDEENDAEYEPYHVVLHVGAAAITTRSGGLAGSEFDFLGAGVGQTLYRLPETENPELIYLGFGAEEVDGGTFQGGQLQLRLKAVNGPGHFSAWQSTDFGPTVAMATSDGITAADFVALLEQGHQHYNFAFTARGSYDVTFEAYATLADGTVTSSGDVTYRFVVNTGADAADDGYSVDEDSTLTVGGPGVLGNDVDPDGDSLVSTLVQGPANGTVTVNPDGSFTYVPNANFSGTDTFTYSVTDVRYRIVPLGTLGGNNSFALDVNNDRQVSGNSSITAGSSNPLQAYVWQNGTFLPLGVLPGTGSNNFSRGYAINDAGVVVGESDNSTSKAFVWNDGIMSGLTRLAGDNFNGAAHDINGAGAIVGISSNGTTSRPTIWTFNGTTYVAADLGTIAGTATSTGRGWAINDAGQVVGLSHNEEGTSQATLWSGGTITNLGSLGDGERFSQAYGLNNHGDVVGSSSTGQTVGQLIGTTSTTSITRAFYWHDEHMHELLPYNFYAPGNTGATTNYHSEAKDINDAGLVVGNSARIAGSAANATLWEHGAVMDLNALIPTGSGWVLRGAEGINQGGDIVGFGSFGGFTRAFLLVPEVVSLDGRLFSNTATVTITVNGTPDAPVAADDAYAVGAGSSVHGNVLFNDSDPDGDPVSVVSSTAAAKGMVVLQANGSFVYTPGASFDGTDSFTYTISDGFGGTDTATVTISLATLPDFEAVLSQGHADIGIFAGSNDTIIDHGDHTHVIEGEFGWDLHVHDHDNDVEYEPDEVLFVVGSAGEAPRPAGIGYDFLGVAAGMPVWTLPQTENPSVPFLGIGTEEIADGTFDADVVSFELVAVDGPGHMSLWTDDATPTVFFATSDGITSADATVLPTGGHAHFNWSFTAPGRYAVTVQARGNVAGEGSSVSDPVTYYFDVVSPPSAPIVTEVAPFVGPTTGGTLVIITGTGFTGATDVSFGGVSGTDVTISPDGTQITVTAPAHGAGTVEVVVTTPGGSNDTAGAANDYTYYVNPAVTSVVINQGTAPITNYSLSGNVVTVTTAGNTTYMAGQKILIAGMANPANNGSFEVQTASTGSNTFTFLNTNIGASSAGFGGTVTAIGGTGSLGTGGVGSQRSMVDSVVYTFNAPVTLGPNAFTLAVNSGVSVGTAPTVNYASPDGGTTWVVTFSGAGVTGNSIADGVYDITFNGSALTSLGTIANRTDTFLRRFGDINGNGIVTGLGDFNPFKAALGTSTGSTAYVAAFDFGANGSITGLGDFNPFNARLGLPAWTGFTVTI